MQLVKHREAKQVIIPYLI